LNIFDFSIHLALQYAVHEVNNALKLINKNVKPYEISKYFHQVETTVEIVREIYKKRAQEAK
jgi:hypothetical protein